MHGTIHDLSCGNINSSADNPGDILNEHLCKLFGRKALTKVIRVHNMNKSGIDDQYRRAYDLEQEAHLRYTPDGSRDNSSCKLIGNETAANVSSESETVMAEQKRG